MNLQRKNDVDEDVIEIMEKEKKAEREIARNAKKESDRLKAIAKKHEVARDRVAAVYAKLKAAEVYAYEQISADHFKAEEKGVSLSEYFPTIHVGDALISVNGRNVQAMSFNDVQEILETTRTPHRCVFVEYLFTKDLIEGKWYSHQELREQNKYVEDPFVRNFIFHQRVREGNIEEVKDLLRRRHDVDSSDYTGCTACHFAASTSNFAMMKLLIENDANVNIPDKNGVTPVIAAALNGSLDVVQYLVENGASLDVEDQNGQTPLYHAIQSHEVDLVHTLLSSGVNIDIKEKRWDWTPLHLSSYEGLSTIVTRLLDMGSNPYLLSRSRKSAKNLAETNGHLNTAKILQDFIFAEPAQCICGGLDEGQSISFDSLKLKSGHFVTPGSKEHAAGPEAGVEAASELEQAYDITIKRLMSHLQGELWCGSSKAVTQIWAKRQKFSKIYTFETRGQPCENMNWTKMASETVKHQVITMNGNEWADVVPFVKDTVDQLESDLCKFKGQKVQLLHLNGFHMYSFTLYIRTFCAYEGSCAMP